jgi:adenosyl cobinamide kinase/adenosyl cobinamide phosphate guanylyltransferase
MIDRENAIVRTIETRIALAENREQHEIWITLDVMREILDLLKEKEKEQDKRYVMMIVDWLRNMAYNNYLDSSHMTFCDAILDIIERAQTGLENYFSDYDSDTKRQEGR